MNRSRVGSQPSPTSIPTLLEIVDLSPEEDEAWDDWEQGPQIEPCPGSDGADAEDPSDDGAVDWDDDWDEPDDLERELESEPLEDDFWQDTDLDD